MAQLLPLFPDAAAVISVKARLTCLLRVAVRSAARCNWLLWTLTAEHWLLWTHLTVICECREQYTRRIQEQENLGKALRDKQKFLRDNQDTSVAQMRMWRDIERLMDCKRRLATSDEPSDQSNTRQAAARSAAAADDDNRLVLWWPARCYRLLPIASSSYSQQISRTLLTANTS